MQISKDNVKFLNDLKKNNDRDWFAANKETYLKHHEEIITFAEAILNEMNKHDEIETINGKKSLHRIYRDTRFSKDKTPYKASWSGSFKRSTALKRGGYFFKILPDEAFVAGGFWGPEPKDLKRIRESIDADPSQLKKVISSKNFKTFFGELKGDGVKTAPKGYAKDHPEIDLLRMKQFMVVRKFSKKEMMEPDFYKEINKSFKAMRPFFDAMSEILTTNANGEVIV